MIGNLHSLAISTYLDGKCEEEEEESGRNPALVSHFWWIREMEEKRIETRTKSDPGSKLCMIVVAE